ncbi:YuzL family protein [Priestia megaterium]|nr:YuzL family protein [Priestia megaterium]
MSEIKKDHSKSELAAPNIQGQGTTTSETGIKKSSSRMKQKRS